MGNFDHHDSTTAAVQQDLSILQRRLQVPRFQLPRTMMLACSVCEPVDFIDICATKPQKRVMTGSFEWGACCSSGQTARITLKFHISAL